MGRIRTYIINVFSSLLLAMAMASGAECADLDISLHIPEWQKWTWAASMQSVLEYYGKNETQCNLANMFNPNPVCCGPLASQCNNSENDPHAIANKFAVKGLNSYATNILSWSECVSLISVGKPFIIDFDYYDMDYDYIGKSYVVANGYDPSANYIDYLDPTAVGAVRATYWWLTNNPTIYALGTYAMLDWGATVVLDSSPAPDCNVTGASSNSNTTATLTGTVNANTRATTATFRLSTSPADQANNFSSFTESLYPTSVSGIYDTSINEAWSGLSPGTTYYYQIKAVSNGGTCLSVPGTFTTGAASAACSSATNGQTLYTKPTTNLCSVGSASTVTGTGPWNWTCTNGSSTASCSAAIQTYQFTVWILSAAGSGTVTPSTGTINWYYGGIMGISGLYNYGTPVTLTATPASGYAFTGWGVDDGTVPACSGTGKCDLIMGASGSTAYASFAPVKTLTVTKSGAGKGTITNTSPTSPVINCGTTCSNLYVQDTSVTLTATPNPGNIFTGWSGACSGKGPCNVTMNAPQSVSAKFVPDITPILNLLFK